MDEEEAGAWLEEVLSAVGPNGNGAKKSKAKAAAATA
jgi:hypothetical protein